MRLCILWLWTLLTVGGSTVAAPLPLAAQESTPHEHPIVLPSPEPLVRVDQLTAATVNLHVYFWYDATQ